jgi:calcium/calmodulin-dependent 3',5'-cyclic nucleotide phosphodiesterase
MNDFSHIIIFYIKNWLTPMEIFAIFVSAIIHDFEHTGTTNNFHMQTR